MWNADDREGGWRLKVGASGSAPLQLLGNFSGGSEHPRWLVDARLNIMVSCFAAPADSPAIIHQTHEGTLKTISVGELEDRTNCVTDALQRRGCGTVARSANRRPAENGQTWSPWHQCFATGP
jgi:acetyl-CoA synthetase